MKITSVEVIPITMPYRRSYSTSMNFRSPLAERALEHVVVRVRADDGNEGIGEASPEPSWPRGLTQGATVEILRTLGPVLVGRDPRNIGEAVGLLERAMVDCPFPVAALDMALWDLAGKCLQVPVYTLLGGLVRPQIRLHYSIGIDRPEVMAENASQAAAQGYEHFKVKVGGPDFEVERRALKAIREALPGAHIRVDANQGWYAAEAVRRLRILQAEVGLELVEQPVPGNDIRGLAHVRREVGIPVMADESCFGPVDALRIVREEAADILNIKLMKCGGLLAARKICAIAEAAGISCFVGSMVETEIGHTAVLHLAASQEVVRYPTGVAAGFGLEPLVRRCWGTEGAVLTVPTDIVGLGVDLDEEILAKYGKPAEDD